MLTEQNATTTRTKRMSEVDSRRRRVVSSASVLVIVMLAVTAIGVAALNRTEAVDTIQVKSNATGDIAPSGEPNLGLLEDYLNGSADSVAADQGVFSGPAWLPNQTALDEVLKDHGVFTGPTWSPNQARIESILNPHQPSGPR